MGMLKEKDKKEIAKIFETLKDEVEFLYFTQDFECDYCSQTREMLEELTSLSPKLSLDVHDFAKEKDLAAAHSIDKIPAIVLIRKKDRLDPGIRYYGVPAGYDFATLLEGVKLLSAGDPKLAPATAEALDKLTSPVHIQVFTTPT
ncbi:MAG: hypothetical protein ACE15D_19140 [Candidatus Eisenbacteria bacterium]|nr:hypothetical protein [Candidatus Eisenbacteria bacterium]